VGGAKVSERLFFERTYFLAESFVIKDGGGGRLFELQNWTLVKMVGVREGRQSKGVL